MMEKLAIQYVSQTEDSLRLISYGIILAGALVAAIIHKSTAELRRAPYFAYCGVLFLIGAASQLVWLSTVSAMTGGFLWVLMLVDVVVGVGAGYALGIIAMARSRDAYGHPRMAVLAFIPFANFWLLLTPSKNEVSAHRAPTIPLLTGALGVFTGLVLLFSGGALRVFIKEEMSHRIAEAEDDPAIQRAGIDMMLRVRGIEETLRQIASEVLWERVDDTTTLLRVVADGTTLRYVYEVSTNPDALPMSMRIGLVQRNCNYGALRPLIEAGATIEHSYHRTDGVEIGVVTVTREICGY